VTKESTRPSEGSAEEKIVKGTGRTGPTPYGRARKKYLRAGNRREAAGKADLGRDRLSTA